MRKIAEISLHQQLSITRLTFPFYSSQLIQLQLTLSVYMCLNRLMPLNHSLNLAGTLITLFGRPMTLRPFTPTAMSSTCSAAISFICSFTSSCHSWFSSILLLLPETFSSRLKSGNSDWMQVKSSQVASVPGNPRHWMSTCWTADPCLWIVLSCKTRSGSKTSDYEQFVEVMSWVL